MLQSGIIGAAEKGRNGECYILSGEYDDIDEGNLLYRGKLNGKEK